MEPSNQDSLNPYQSPSADMEASDVSSAALPDPAIVKKFREQIHALGAFWIIIGGVACVLMVIVFAGSGKFLLGGLEGTLLLMLAGITALMGIAWVVLGIMTCLKNPWAVYTGLVLSYISLVLQALNLNICAIVILIVVILQAHRVIGWAKRMQAMGVPLTTKP